MGLYYEGYADARQYIKQASLKELLDTLDALYGRDNLKYGDGIDEVRAEAMRQTEREFTDKSSPEYERREFFLNTLREDGNR